MAKKVIKWFDPKKQTGWKKSQSMTTRRFHLLATTDKRMSLHKRYIQAGNRAQALANVQKDPATKRLAKSDANYFFAKGRK